MRLIGAGTRDDIQYVERHTFWTVPNLITLARFLLVPVFVYLVAGKHFVLAFWTLALLFSTDWVDGYIARRFNQISSVGKWLDPLADRLSLLIVAGTFVVFGIAPAWLIWCILIPDLILIANALILFRGSPELPVSVLGKLRTAVLMGSAPLLLLAQSDHGWAPTLAGLCTVMLAVGTVLHVMAAGGYLFAARAKAARLRSGGVS